MGPSIRTLVNELRCFTQRSETSVRLRQTPQPELKTRHPWLTSLKESVS